MFGFFRRLRADAKRLKALDAVMLGVGRGVFKRIDENRELLDLLQHESPELLKRCFWISDWLEDQDRFLVERAEAAKTVNPHGAHKNSAVQALPQPWPGNHLHAVQKSERFHLQTESAPEDL